MAQGAYAMPRGFDWLENREKMHALILNFGDELKTSRSFLIEFFQTSCPLDDDKISVILSSSLVTYSPSTSMAAFGWSAGDLVASIKIAITIAGVLKESGGAKANFQEATESLFGLEVTFQNLKSISPVLAIQSQQEVKRILKPLNSSSQRLRSLIDALDQGVNWDLGELYRGNYSERLVFQKYTTKARGVTLLIPHH